MWELFRLVLSLTCVSFGGGQILLAGLERALVQTGRLSEHDFAAAVALGQSTPGPLASFAAALGLKLHGVGGAIGATLGLAVVSLGAAAIIARLPGRWFQLPAVKGALGSIAPLAAGLAFFLAVRTLLAGQGPGLAGGLVIGAVATGRLYRVPTYALLPAAITASLFLS